MLAVLSDLEVYQPLDMVDGWGYGLQAARKRLDDKKKHSDKKKSRSNKNFD